MPNVIEYPGSYPEDFNQENGQYLQKCPSCGALFCGHKRRYYCKECFLKDSAIPTVRANTVGFDSAVIGFLFSKNDQISMEIKLSKDLLEVEFTQIKIRVIEKFCRTSLRRNLGKIIDWFETSENVNSESFVEFMESLPNTF